MSSQDARCAARQRDGRLCPCKQKHGSYCGRHQRLNVCMAWTPDGPCQTEPDNGNYCPKHTRTP